jgi:protein TonB
MKPIIRADLDEMVFEGKNHDYGAYYLRKHYGRYLLVASLIGAFAFSFFMYLPAIGEYFENNKADKEQKVFKAVELSLENLPPPPPPDDDPPPPPPPKVDLPPPKLRTVAFRIPDPKPKEEIQDDDQEVVTVAELEEAPNIGLEDIEGEDVGFIDIPDEGTGTAPAAVIEEKEPEPDFNEFVFVSQEPEPINMDDVQALIGYPDVARESNIEGKVVVRILVGKDGRYLKHKVIKKAHPILAQAVEAHIGKLTFTPALQGNQPIKFWVNVPFSFQLIN